MHEFDFIERIRRKYISYLHLILSYFGLYAEADSPPRRYSCTVHKDEEEFEKVLDEIGFYRNPLAALKSRDREGEVEYSEGSWFYFTMEDPISFGPFDLPKYQYHLTIYNHVDGKAIDLYMHKELWWGTDPEGHYDGHYLKSAPGWLRDKLDEHDVEYIIVNTTS